MDKSKTKLNKILSAMDDSTITTEQFVAYVEKLVDFVKSMKDMNDKEISDMRQTFTSALSSIKNDSNSSLSEMKKMVSDVVQSELKKVETVTQSKLEEMMAKADALEDGKDADEEVIVTEVLKRIPPAQVDFTPVEKRIKEVEDKIVPFDYKRLDDVEKMAKANAMPITTSFINGRRAKNINFTGSGAIVSYDGDAANVVIAGGSGVDVTLAGEDYLSLTDQEITANPIDLDNLSATGTPSASTFLRGDNSWATPSGSGDVSKVGTPVDNQVGVWTGDGTIEGDSALTFDTSTDTLTVGAGAGIVTTHAVRSDSSDGLILESNNGTDVGILGAGNTANVTWYGAHNFDTQTQDTIAAFTGSGKTLGSLATATYPSLTELSYVKGVTSAIQTQLNAKGTGTVTSVAQTVPTGLTISGSPVTTTGTLAIALDTGYVIPLQTTLDGKANTALDNLASVAINTSLISDTDSTDSIGSTGVRWLKGWFDDMETTNMPTVGGTSLSSITQTLTNKTIEAPILDYVIEPASDDTYEGETTNDKNAGATIAQWECVYGDATAGEWLLTDADAVATAGGVLLALAQEAGTDGNPMRVVFRGVVRNDGWTWSGAFKPLYLSTTPGALTETAPSATDDVVRVVGYTLSDDCIYFNPSNDWATVV